MKQHICKECGRLIYEELDGYERVFKKEGICSLCSMKSDDKQQLKRDAQEWRDKKLKEILEKGDKATEIEREMIEIWGEVKC